MKKITALVLVLLTFVVLAVPVEAQVKSTSQPRTTTSYKTATGSGGVELYPYLSGDKKTLYLDFESPNLRNVEYIYYNLNYDTHEPQSLRGAETKFTPDPKDFRYYNGKPYVRKLLVTGTCSKNVCKYHSHPHNIRITVTTKFKGVKKEQTRVYNISH